MEQPELELLRRKLDALGYDHPVDEFSGPLVQKLVDDLVHTTESYRGLKQQSVVFTNHISDLQDKAPLSPFNKTFRDIMCCCCYCLVSFSLT